MAEGKHKINGVEVEYEDSLQRWDQKYTELIVNKPLRVIGRSLEGFLRGYTWEQGITTSLAPFNDYHEYNLYHREQNPDCIEKQNVPAIVVGSFVGGVQDLFTFGAGIIYRGAKATGAVFPEANNFVDNFAQNPFTSAAVALFNAKIIGQSVSLIYSIGKKVGGSS